MRFLSLFDGCHMFGHALRNVGAECVGTSEIDKHARAVTRYHYPDTPQLGSVTNVESTTANLIVAGFPCQDLSVAGDRRGLAGERSGLFWQIIRIARESSTPWLLLENVPGLLSSSGGRDMGAVLGALGKLGYGWAYRVLDSQYFGVSQRRRRVFIVGCLGDSRSAGQVLFEPESVRGASAPSREAGAGAPGGVAKCLTAHGQRLDGETETFVVADTVRRLTPIECERLQGLPDDWTRYGRKEDGTVYEVKDGPRYAMIGNGGAVPVVEWVGRRIQNNLTP